jgi:hypothetical protein
MSQFNLCFHTVIHLQLLGFKLASTITTFQLPQDYFHFSLNAPFSSPITHQYLTPSFDPQKTACFSLVIHSTRKELLSLLLLQSPLQPSPLVLLLVNFCLRILNFHGRIGRLQYVNQIYFIICFYH